MAYTAGFSVNVGDPTKASDVSTLAANDDFLKNAIDTFIANDANNRVLTGTGSGTANGEANLTFDGSTLALTGAQTISSTLAVSGLLTASGGVSGALTGNVTGNISGNVTGGTISGTISGTTGTFSGDVAVNTSTLKVDTGNNRVGVKNASPSYPLDIGYTAGINQVAWRGSSNEIGFLTYGSSTDAGAVQLSSGGAAKILLDAAGTSYVNTGSNFGIGTASPASGGTDTQNVHVHNSTSHGTYFKLSNNATGATASDGFDLIMGTSSDAYVFNRENGPIIFGTNAAEKMRLTSAGRVGINIDDTKNAMLYVEQDSGSTAGGIQIGRSGGGLAWAISNVGSNLRFGMDSTADGTVDIDSVTFDYQGLVGVGTSSPTEKMDVTGAVKASAAANNWGYSASFFDRSGNDTRVVAGATSGNSSNIAFWTYNSGTQSQKAVITNDGNLLVGGTSQSGTANRAAVFSAGKFGLSIIDTTAQAANVGGALNLGGNYRSDGDAQAFARIEAVKENATDANYAYGMAFSVTPNGASSFSTEAVRILSDGKTGIGTASPGTKLTIQNNDSTAYANAAPNLSVFPFQLVNENNHVSGGTFTGIHFNLTGDSANRINYIGSITESSSQASALVFGTDNGSRTEKFRIASNGTCAFTTADINVLFNGTTSSRLLTDNNGVEIYTGGYIWASRQATSLYLSRSGAAGEIANFRYNAATSVGSISVTSSATAFNTSSDYRLKENLSPITGAVDRVNALKPQRFNFINSPDVTVDGFLAHEVSPVVPEAITGEKDAVDEKGEPEYQGIDQSKLVPLLTAAIQELTARIEALEAA